MHHGCATNFAIPKSNCQACPQGHPAPTPTCNNDQYTWRRAGDKQDTYWYPFPGTAHIPMDKDHRHCCPHNNRGNAQLLVTTLVHTAGTKRIDHPRIGNCGHNLHTLSSPPVCRESDCPMFQTLRKSHGTSDHGQNNIQLQKAHEQPSNC
jgi:hypothetical protein